MKSLPSTYNLDFQEITPKLWESVENVRASLDMFHKLHSQTESVDGRFR